MSKRHGENADIVSPRRLDLRVPPLPRPRSSLRRVYRKWASDQGTGETRPRLRDFVVERDHVSQEVRIKAGPPLVDPVLPLFKHHLQHHVHLRPNRDRASARGSNT